jgi:hypothetical protein
VNRFGFGPRQFGLQSSGSKHKIATGGLGFKSHLHCKISPGRKGAMGHSRHIHDVRAMSACTPIATELLRRSAIALGIYPDDATRSEQQFRQPG